MEGPGFVRWCPDCQEEFRPDIDRCSDCGGELVTCPLDDRGRAVVVPAMPAAAGATAPMSQPLPEGYSILTAATTAADLRPLTDALADASVRFEVRFDPDLTGEYRSPVGGRFVVAVADGDRRRGVAAIRQILGHEGDEAAVLSVETAFDVGSGYARCPACAVSITPSAEACPECGLVFRGDGA